MTTKFIHVDIWQHIKTLTKKSPNNCFVAVAYFGKGGSKLLPLKKGSTLIVDMSMSAVKAGQTNPDEILKLVKSGVDVHSVENLHAKVFVIGNKAIVGSTNVSSNSSQSLVEAVVETTQQSTVSSSRNFVKSLRGELITPEYAKKMQSHYKPPIFSGGKGHGSNRRSKPKHAPLWIAPLIIEDWDAEDYVEEKAGAVIAKRKLESSRTYRIEDFLWEGSLPKQVKENNLLMQVTQEKKSKYMVAPRGRILYIRRYKSGRTNKAIVYIEVKKGANRKNLNAIIHKLGPKGKELKKSSSVFALRDWSFIHSLLNLWGNA